MLVMPLPTKHRGWFDYVPLFENPQLETLNIIVCKLEAGTGVLRTYCDTCKINTPRSGSWVGHNCVPSEQERGINLAYWCYFCGFYAAEDEYLIAHFKYGRCGRRRTSSRLYAQRKRVSKYTWLPKYQDIDCINDEEKVLMLRSQGWNI